MLVWRRDIAGGAALANTAALLAQSRRTTRVLFDHRVPHRDARVRVDAVPARPARRHADRGEVDHGREARHIWDCAIQTWVAARGSGRNVTKDRAGAPRSRLRVRGRNAGLLVRQDILAGSRTLQPNPTIVTRLKRVARGEDTRHRHRRAVRRIRTRARSLSICRSAEPPVDFPVTLLPHARLLIERLQAEGHTDLRKGAAGRTGERRALGASRAPRARTVLDLAHARAGAGRHRLPATFLDFETIMYAVPRWLGTRPFQQLPFQFSCHCTQQRDGRFTHAAFLDVSGRHSLARFVDALLDAVGKKGPILVWNGNFGRPACASWPCSSRQGGCTARDHRTHGRPAADLHRDHYYHRDMAAPGRSRRCCSTVAPELDYADLAVGDGSAAGGVREAIHPDTPDARREELKGAAAGLLRARYLATTRLMAVRTRRGANRQRWLDGGLSPRAGAWPSPCIACSGSAAGMPCSSAPKSGRKIDSYPGSVGSKPMLLAALADGVATRPQCAVHQSLCVLKTCSRVIAAHPEWLQEAAVAARHVCGNARRLAAELARRPEPAGQFCTLVAAHF